MTPTFTLSIPADGVSTITHAGRADTVVRVRYILTATDGVNSQSFNSVVELKPSENGSFTPFENLTHDQVIEWVRAAISPENMRHYEMGLTRALNLKANPPPVPMARPVPWTTCTQA